MCTIVSQYTLQTYRFIIKDFISKLRCTQRFQWQLGKLSQWYSNMQILRKDISVNPRKKRLHQLEKRTKGRERRFYCYLPSQNQSDDFNTELAKSKAKSHLTPNLKRTFSTKWWSCAKTQNWKKSDGEMTISQFGHKNKSDTVIDLRDNHADVFKNENISPTSNLYM